MSKIQLDKEFRIKTPCPSVLLPDHVKRPKLEVTALKIVVAKGQPSSEQVNTGLIFGVHEELTKQGLCIKTVRSTITKINTCNNSATICCSRIPKDTQMPGLVCGGILKMQTRNKKHLDTTSSCLLELDLKLELPVAATNIAGNAEEGSMLIVNNEQIDLFHKTQAAVDIADAKYDITKNYQYLRDKGSIPIIDYNRRREKITAADLRKRGYDTNGWPYAPCGMLTKPNGFDCKNQRHTFCCFKQCLKLKVIGIKSLQDDYDIGSCRHIRNRNGYSRHMTIKEHPRLQNKIPRGTKRYNTIKKVISASERANSTIKEDIRILDKPIVYNKEKADIIGQIAAIVLLIQRAMAFIVKTTILLKKLAESTDPDVINKMHNHSIPKSIRFLIQLE